MTKKLILLRHGKTGFAGQYIGAKDVSLSPDGCQQIASLKQIFQAQQIDQIFSSPMLRCRESAEILFADHPVNYDDDLREIDFGRWEGLSFQEIATNDPELVDKWAVWSPDFCFPEGECIAHFLTRVHRAGSRIKESSNENIILIAHGGVIRALLCYLLNLKPENYLLFQIKKGKYATLDLFSEGAVLTGFNLG